MWNPFRIGGFERRLVISFLLVSVIPVILIAFFSARYFMKSVDLVSNPAVEQSFRNSMEIARDFSAKLEEDAACVALRLADGLSSKPRMTGDELKAFLRDISEETHVDFAATYVLEASSWKLKTSYPTSVPRIEPAIGLDAVPKPAEPRRIAFRDPDVIASGLVTGDKLVVAGFTLEKGFTEKMRKTGDDLGRYQAVGLYVRVQRRYIIIVTCVLVVLMAISATLASRLLASRISQPITELAHATEEIAKGDLEYRVTVNAKDEILSLVNGFNKMTEELEENKKNLIIMAKREAQVARDFEIARQVQESLFPTALPAIPGWQFAATCRTAKVVGGDYYDVFEVAPGKVLLAQGDVSGKGVGASLTMASVHAIIRSSGGAPSKITAGTNASSLMPDASGLRPNDPSLAGNDADLGEIPSRLIEELNRYLVSSQTPEMFVTLFLGLLDCDKSRLWYVNCGHPPAIVLRSRDAKPETLGIGGMVLGVKETAAYEVGQCRLEAGDTLVLVSDGVTEARNLKNQLYGETRLAETWSDDHDESASETMQRILSSVDGFMEGADQADDISILVLKSRGQLSGNW